MVALLISIVEPDRNLWLILNRIYYYISFYEVSQERYYTAPFAHLSDSPSILRPTCINRFLAIDTVFTHLELTFISIINFIKFEVVL